MKKLTLILCLILLPTLLYAGGMMLGIVGGGTPAAAGGPTALTITYGNNASDSTHEPVATAHDFIDITVPANGNYLILASGIFWRTENTGEEVDIDVVNGTTILGRAYSKTLNRRHSFGFVATQASLTTSDHIKLRGYSSGSHTDVVNIADAYLAIINYPDGLITSGGDLTGGTVSSATADLASISITPSASTDVLVIGSVLVSGQNSTNICSVWLRDDTGTKSYQSYLGFQSTTAYFSDQVGFAQVIPAVDAERVIKLQATAPAGTDLYWDNAWLVAIPTSSFAVWDHVGQDTRQEAGADTSFHDALSKTWTPASNVPYVILQTALAGKSQGSDGWPEVSWQALGAGSAYWNIADSNDMWATVVSGSATWYTGFFGLWAGTPGVVERIDKMQQKRASSFGTAYMDDLNIAIFR